MIGDVLLIKERHHLAAAAIDERLAQLDLERPVVAISGESGSGKSEVAHLLRVKLKARGRRAKILHTDNYYRVPPAERAAWREANVVERCVGPSEYRWELIEEHLAAFRAGEDGVTLPFLDIVTDQEDQLTTGFSTIDVMILEGLYAIGAAEADLKALIDLTYHDTKDAQTLRGKEPQTQLRARVLEAEHQAMLKLREGVDLLLTKALMGMDR